MACPNHGRAAEYSNQIEALITLDYAVINICVISWFINCNLLLE